MAVQLDILPIGEWLPSGGKPVIVAGPCSAESEEQVLLTARQLAADPRVKIFRSGIWKPRTRPNLFEGVGSAGLEWLGKVRQETGLMTTVEVANPVHVESALRAGVDILWIGARTVVNPFSIEELAQALSGVDMPVMIKNPVNPDLELWIGALERINAAGIRRLIAVHRGFSHYDRSPYRNNPMWEIPIELKRQVPQLPLLCDPSHICGGRKDLLLPVAQKALDLDMNGLMVEVHHNPARALTDKQQQITPGQFETLLTNVVFRKGRGDSSFGRSIERLRAEIDRLDLDLIGTLASRMKLVDEIGNFKRDHNVTILQIERWSDIVNERLKTGETTGLEREFLQKIFEAIHNESIRRQSDILNPPEE